MGHELIDALVMRSLSWLGHTTLGIAILGNIFTTDYYETVRNFAMRQNVKNLVLLRDLDLNDASFREAQINHSSSQALLSQDQRRYG